MGLNNQQAGIWLAWFIVFLIMVTMGALTFRLVIWILGG